MGPIEQLSCNCEVNQKEEMVTDLFGIMLGITARTAKLHLSLFVPGEIHGRQKGGGATVGQTMRWCTTGTIQSRRQSAL